MRYCVVGLGAAAAQAIPAIRSRDPEGEITVFSEEPWPFYFRASLPQYVMGKLSREQLWGFPDGYLESLNVRRVTGRVVAVDKEARQVVTEDGSTVPYDRVLLGTGTSPIKLACPGADLGGVLALGRMGEADVLKGYCRAGGRAVVVGGGLPGLTLARMARAMGMACTLLVPEDRVGAPWLDARGSQVLYRRVADDGVEIRMGEGVAAIEGGQGKVAAVTTTHGKGIACSWVGVGLGGMPRTALAGVMTDDKPLKVNERMATDVAGVFAAGDVCCVWDGDAGTHRYTPGWQAASLQGRVAGANMAGGRERFRMRHSFLAATLYDLPLTFIGRADSAGDAEVCSPPQADAYRRLVFKDGRLVGAVILGDRRHANVIRRVIELGVNARGHELQLLRTDIDLNHLLRPTGEYHLY
ncbi:MAG: FAD-dependent oxidoreductase [Nitrospirae bacterium]|nr:FAD-dependent oxidoreductase [Nitrospirota bacterium]